LARGGLFKGGEAKEGSNAIRTGVNKRLAEQSHEKL
jgi:hypothetical protein